MGHRSIRFPEELEARVQALAKAEDRAFSYVVVRTLEKALAVEARGAPPVGPVETSAPSRAPVPHVPTRHELAMERQRLMNERRK